MAGCGECRGSKTAILAVSFGTSYNESRDLTIGAIEERIMKKFPAYEVRRAFTSQIIIDKLKRRDGLEIDNVEEALARAANDGIVNLVVQPTHLTDGYEYSVIKNALKDYEDKFSQVILGEPLLSADTDFDAVLKAITHNMAPYDDQETAICFLGHGTRENFNRIYVKMQEKLIDSGFDNYYIGTMKARPSLDDVIAAFKKKSIYRRVILAPLMVVAGEHANNDMAGEGDGSWKTILESQGYEVECVFEGLGQITAIQDIYAAHAKAAVDSLA